MSRPPHNPTVLVLKLLGLAAAAAIAVGLQAGERAGGGDLYGYGLSMSGQGGQCRFDYVDLASAGAGIALVPGHPLAADDDRAGILPLVQPFELYQTSHRALVVSANGYLAAADSLKGDDGSDFSNDCKLPARADNPAASTDRIYVYHDDLRPQAGGGIRQAHFATCPRTSAKGAAEACTVVEWNGFERTGPVASTQPLRAQAVLYHASHEVALQYASVDDSRAANATIGLQGLDGRAARQAGCNALDQVAPRRAICFHDPRHRPGRRADE